MAPGSILYHISFQSTLFFYLLLSIYIIKIPKIFILLSISDLTFASGREGIDNPFIELVAWFVFVCVGVRDSCMASYWIDTLVLKNRGNTYATLLHHPFLFKGKPMQCSRGSKKDFLHHCRGVYAQVKTYQVPITNSYPSHYTICHLPLVFLSPTSPLPFLRPSSVRSCVSMFLIFACIFAC